MYNSFDFHEENATKTKFHTFLYYIHVMYEADFILTILQVEGHLLRCIKRTNAHVFELSFR